jgi:DNA-binding winged helix-turn-helix (wHTH) protein/tetratricopeptide (TPR) repeat protein
MFPGINARRRGLDVDVRAARFGLFVFDPRSSELSKNGRPVQVQHQPLQVLGALLDHPGELVSREALRQRLWPDGVHVEFDQSLNKSITKLREALGDSASNPRFIETLPKRGYRFIAPVAPIDDIPSAPPAGGRVSGTPAERAQAPASVPRLRLSSRPWAIAAGLIGLLTALAWLATLDVNVGAAAKEQKPAAPRPVARSPIYAAKDAYERGRLALSRQTPDGLMSALEHFQATVALSPRFASGYVGLADAWSLMSSHGLIDPREGMPRAREAANRALSLQSSLARAHASLARTAMIFDWDRVAAEWHFSRALQIDSADATAHRWYAYYLSAIGRHDEAIDEARRAVAADPLSLTSNTALGFVLYLARRYDEAAAQLERTLKVDPDFAQARRDLALVRVQQGRLDDALAGLVRVALLNERAPTATAELAWVQALSGRRTAARAALTELDQLRAHTFVSPDAIALIYSGLGAHEEAIVWLQRAFTMRSASLAQLAVDPMWDTLRSHPRVHEMIAAIRRQ